MSWSWCKASWKGFKSPPADVLPLPAEIIGQHAAHAKDKADGHAGHDIASVHEPGDEIGGGNPHSPQHQDIDDGGEADLAHSIDKADNTVEHRIAPGKGQHGGHIAHSDVRHSRFLCEESNHRAAVENHEAAGGSGYQGGKQGNPDSAFFQIGVIFRSQVLTGKCGGRAGKGRAGHVCNVVDPGAHCPSGHKDRALKVDQ